MAVVAEETTGVSVVSAEVAAVAVTVAVVVVGVARRGGGRWCGGEAVTSGVATAAKMVVLVRSVVVVAIGVERAQAKVNFC